MPGGSMAGSIYQLQSPVLLKNSEEKERHRQKKSRYTLWKEFFSDPSKWVDRRNSKLGPTFPDFKHKITQDSLWIDGWHNPSWVVDELRSRGLALPTQATDREVFQWNHPTIHDQNFKLFHGNNQVIHDEVASFVALLRACTKNKDLTRGSRLHDDILKRGLLEKCSDALVSMYAKCGALAKAKELLDMHDSRSVFTWTALLAGFSRDRRSQDALDCFERMQNEGLSPDAVTYTCILKACGAIGAMDKGKLIHDEIAKQGLLENNAELGNALVDMYAKCGAFAQAQRVLEELPSPDVVSWNSLIAGFAQDGRGEQALNCFERMLDAGFSPNAVTYTCILKACGTLGAVEKGKKFHDEIANQGLLGTSIALGNALVDMYVKCGALVKAQSVLEELPLRNVVSWSTLIAGYAQQGLGKQALECYEKMQGERVHPNGVTFACVLKACGNLGAADKGKQIHNEITRQGLLRNNIVLGNALVDMYAKCGALAEAHRVLHELPFRDVISWNALITVYSQRGQSEQAIDCFERMQDDGVSPNAVTFACILKACGTLGAAEKGKQIHHEITRQGLLENDVVLGTALVDMYAKCGALTKARRVLEELPSRNVVSWSALIAGYAQQGQGEQAMNCFKHMQRDGIFPNAVTFVGILNACSALRAADKGKEIHDEIVRQGLLRNNVVLGNALVDMYAKCGALAKAERVLEELPSRDVVSWNSLIAGYVQQGQSDQALNCFKRMQCEDILPDAVTFSCVLNVCSHIGLVEEGNMYFESMSTKYGVKPDLETYTCMIDLFGRAGHLEKAVQVIQDMPSSDHSAVWHALLGACQKWGDVSVGRWAFEQALQVDKSDGPAYVLMANIYAAAGMKENAKNIEAMRTENKAWKYPGRSSWIDMGGVHAFSVGDTEHAQNKYIFAELEDFSHKISWQG